jgi:hypothetical protein
MDRNTGTYQISFKNIKCDKLEDVEIGVLPITKKYKEGNIFNREYEINFAGHPLEFRRFFKINLNQLSQIKNNLINIRIITYSLIIRFSQLLKIQHWQYD